MGTAVGALLPVVRVVDHLYAAPVHAGKVHRIAALRGHHGVRVAVAQRERLDVCGSADCPKGRTCRKPEIHSSNGSGLKHAGQVDGGVGGASPHDVRVAAAQGKRVDCKDAVQCRIAPVSAAVKSQELHGRMRRGRRGLECGLGVRLARGRRKGKGKDGQRQGQHGRGARRPRTGAAAPSHLPPPSRDARAARAGDRTPRLQGQRHGTCGGGL